jgi:hypothetical protein
MWFETVTLNIKKLLNYIHKSKIPVMTLFCLLYICYAPRISLGFIHTKPYSCYAPRISLGLIHTKPYSCYAPRISLGCIHTKPYIT